MASFDAASKKQVETNPQDFVDLCFKFGLKNITVLEVVTLNNLPLKCIRQISL